MSKKKLALVFILMLLGVGGVFLWQKNQKDVAELNKNLPDGIRVVKNLQGEYWVVNKLDGYEFKTPQGWKGIREIKYTPERTEQGYTGTSIGITGKEGMGRLVGIDRFKIEDSGMDLETWAKTEFETLGLVGDFNKEKVEEIAVAKTQENVHLGGDYVYFFKQDYAIYAIMGGSEEFIREIISSGKW